MEPEPVVTACPRHPAVECHVRCTRCERCIRPDRVREASAGHRCPVGVPPGWSEAGSRGSAKEGARSVRRARTLAGGRGAATPVVTYALIALNALVYVAEVVRPEIADRFPVLTTGGLVAAFAHAPRDGRRTLVQAGAGAALLVVLAVAAPARVTALTGGGAA